MENYIFPLKKYKNYTYKQVLDKNDTKYFKYLINNFKFLFEDIYDFYVYLRDNNKLINEINKCINIKILIDTETTGFSNNDLILQIAYIVFNEYEIIKTFNQIIKINTLFKIKNSFIHGINNLICEKNGICIIDALNRLNNDIKYCNSIIGHNTIFDIRMLKNEYLRNKIDCTNFISKKIEDTMTIYGKRIKLGELYFKLFNNHMENAHNAIYDVLATYKIYNKLIN
jgi:DNA polymerase III epsilon subunit-like protein